MQGSLPQDGDSLHIFASAGACLGMADVWGELAVRKVDLGDHPKALELFESALRLEIEAGTLQNYLVHPANIGNVYLHRGDHLAATEDYRRALELAREIKGPVGIQMRSYNLRLAYARLRQSVDRLDSRTA